jgi:hypothetical protein
MENWRKKGRVCELGRGEVMRETRLAVMVRLLEAIGSEPYVFWIPKLQLMPGNECEKLGDVGECVTTMHWWENMRTQPRPETPVRRTAAAPKQTLMPKLPRHRAVR